MRLDLADVVKTVITSTVISGVVMYGTQQVLQAEMENLKQDFRDYKIIINDVVREQARRQPMIDYTEQQMQRRR